MSDFIRGPAVVIDDGIQNPKDDIYKIIGEIQGKEIPCALYADIPESEDEFIKHAKALSFLLLDWEILPQMDEEPTAQAKQDIIKVARNDLLAFMEKVLRNTFIPIFLFTAEKDLDKIKGELKKKGLYSDYESKNRIFVENKKKLLKGQLFKKIDKWIKENPSIYVLKEWDREYQNSKNELFMDFYELSHAWPKVLWDTYDSDGVPPSMGLGDSITRNLLSRMAPFEFDKKNLEGSRDIEKSEIRKVLAGERFISQERLHNNIVNTGDFFLEEASEKKSYFLNIRANCDCIARNGSDVNEVMLYLLKAKRLTPGNEKKAFKNGHFEERENKLIVFNLYENASFEIFFNDLILETYGNFMDRGGARKLGKLLDPHINRIQQRYSRYIERQGLPRIPNAAVLDSEPMPDAVKLAEPKARKAPKKTH